MTDELSEFFQYAVSNGRYEYDLKDYDPFNLITKRKAKQEKIPSPGM